MADAKRYEYQALFTLDARRDRYLDVTLGPSDRVITRPG